jgi:hypothetical protein
LNTSLIQELERVAVPVLHLKLPLGKSLGQFSH